MVSGAVLDSPAKTRTGRHQMLILTRRLGESVKIDDEVTVTVLAIKGSHVRLGFTPPRNVAVHREEVYAQLQAAGALESDTRGFPAATLRP